MVTKAEILDRLFKEGQVTMEEILILSDKEIIYLQAPQTQPYWVGTRPDWALFPIETTYKTENIHEKL